MYAIDRASNMSLLTNPWQDASEVPYTGGGAKAIHFGKHGQKRTVLDFYAFVRLIAQALFVLIYTFDIYLIVLRH